MLTGWTLSGSVACLALGVVAVLELDIRLRVWISR